MRPSDDVTPKRPGNLHAAGGVRHLVVLGERDALVGWSPIAIRGKQRSAGTRAPNRPAS